MKQNLFKSIADLRFAIFILLMIAALSIIGTVIEQDQSIETYKLNYPLTNRVFGFLSWDIILRFGFDHIYKTWWFITLILLFGVSLLTCTLLQQFPSLKVARRCQFFRTTQQFCRLNISTNLQHLSLSQLLFKIKENNYSIFQQKNIIYCYKGLIGRIAPIIVHFSMIIILIGAIIGSVGGFKAQEIIPKTETFHIQNVLNNGQFTLIPKVSIRINDFWITYTKQTTITQFYSDLSILNVDGNEVERKTIFVNSPAKYNGIDYYQTDWNIIGLRIKNKDFSIFQYPFINLPNTKEKVWLTWISSNPQLNDGLTILIDNLQWIIDKHQTELDILILNKEDIFPDSLKSKKNRLNSFFKGYKLNYYTITNVPIDFAMNCFEQIKKVDLIAKIINKESFLKRLVSGSKTDNITYESRVPLLIMHPK